MSEYASRGRGFESSYAPRSSQGESYAPPPRSPAELAEDAVTTLARDVTSARYTLDAIRTAHDANDLSRWAQAHADLDRHLVTTRKDLERARARQVDASGEVQSKLAVIEATFAELAEGSHNLQAPLGWSPVSRESDILRVLTTPVEGDARVGFAQKEQAIRDELARLPLTESRALLSRLRTSHAHYDDAAYAKLAAVLAKAITHEGRVEVQWTDDPESASQAVGSRGHIEGPALFNALQATGREVSVEEIEPELDYEYSIKPSTRKSGADPAKNHVPTRPVPKFRWILTFK